MKKSKKFLSFAAAMVMLTAVNAPAFEGFNPFYGENAGITAEAASFMEVRFSDKYGDWVYEADYASPDSDGNYRNLNMRISKFTPKASHPRSLTISSAPGSSCKVKINNKNCYIKSGTVTGINNDVFINTDFTSVSLPASIKEIGDNAFCDCVYIENFTFGSNSNLIKIGKFAFSGCASLQSITLPGKLKYLDVGSFCSCTSLKTISIPYSVSTVDKDCFSKCGLVSINGNVEAMEDLIYTLNRNLYIKKINGKNIYSGSGINTELKDLFLTHSKYANVGDNSAFDHLMDNMISDIVVTQTRNCKNDYQKAKALHDWVRNKADYYYSDASVLVAGDPEHCDYSIFLNSYSASDGFARGYKLLLDKAGIENYFAFSENQNNPKARLGNHMWNIVTINGLNYHVDCAADDLANNDSFFLFFDSTYPNSEHQTSIYKSGRYKCAKSISQIMFRSESWSGLPIKCDLHLGDQNGDGAVDINDMTILASYVKYNNIPLQSLNSKVLDLNGDKKINSTDLSLFEEFFKYGHSYKYIEYYFLHK